MSNSKPEKLFLHLLGKTGTGKSATGNSILGRKTFRAKPSLTAVTQVVQIEQRYLGCQLLQVVDGPGVIAVDIGLSADAAHQFTEIIRANQDSAHAFLIVCRYGERFTEETQELVLWLRETFGENVLKQQSIVVMTCGDNFVRDTEDENLTFQQWCEEQTGAFSNLRRWCDNRVLLVNNTQSSGDKDFLSALQGEIAKLRYEKMKGKHLVADSERGGHGKSKKTRDKQENWKTSYQVEEKPSVNIHDDGFTGSPSSVFHSQMSNSKPEKLFLHLLGKTGTGKSATGNSILGRKTFRAKPSLTAVTQVVQIEQRYLGCQLLEVVDGPGVISVDIGLSADAAHQFTEIIRANQDSAHAFLIVCRYGERFTEETQELVQWLGETFGENVLKQQSIVVMTCGDNFVRDTEDENLTFQQWCEEQTGAFSNLRRRCDNRVLLVNNTHSSGDKDFLSALQGEIAKLRYEKMKGKHLVADSERGGHGNRRKREDTQENRKRSYEVKETYGPFETEKGNAVLESKEPRYRPLEQRSEERIQHPTDTESTIVYIFNSIAQQCRRVSNWIATRFN